MLRHVKSGVSQDTGEPVVAAADRVVRHRAAYLGGLPMSEPEQMFSNPQTKECEDYVTGRFG